MGNRKLGIRDWLIWVLSDIENDFGVLSENDFMKLMETELDNIKMRSEYLNELKRIFNEEILELYRDRENVIMSRYSKKLRL
tara:strand:+ start:51 stop:296 length:246 start_codon:yes stop_codon:yes gene_type:complete